MGVGRIVPGNQLRSRAYRRVPRDFNNRSEGLDQRPPERVDGDQPVEMQVADGSRRMTRTRNRLIAKIPRQQGADRQMGAQIGLDAPQIGHAGACITRIIESNVSGPHTLQARKHGARHARSSLDRFKLFESQLCECSSNDRDKGSAIGGSAEATSEARREQRERGDIAAVVSRSRRCDTLHTKGESALDDDGVTLHGI